MLDRNFRNKGENVFSCQCLPSRPVSLLLRLHSALTARLATHSNVESPIKRLKIPNSTSREPAPAVQVSLMLSGGTPVFRFTCIWMETQMNQDDEWHFKFQGFYCHVCVWGHATSLTWYLHMIGSSIMTVHVTFLCILWGCTIIGNVIGIAVWTCNIQSQ